MLVVCAGMFRSGSTWQYQVACEWLRRSGRPFEAAGFLGVDQLPGYLQARPDPNIWHVFKTHVVAPYLDRVAADGAGVVLYCYRDLRDVVYSMAHKVGGGFADVVNSMGIIDRCLAADAFWTAQPGVFVQRYEEWVLDSRPAVREIARRLGVAASDAAVEEVAATFSLRENRQRTEQFTTQLHAKGVDTADPTNAYTYDPASLLHWNHVRAGEVGGWRAAATPEELALLAEKCGHWLVARGYEPDLAWGVRPGTPAAA